MSQGPTLFEPVVLATADDGKTEFPRPTPLQRLHYFDGKFLRADDLTLEQNYTREIVRLANLAGGTGVVYGLDTTLGLKGSEIVIGPGMAIDPGGKFLLLANRDYHFDIDDLIARSSRIRHFQALASVGAASFDDCEVVSQQKASAITLTSGYTFYLITLGFAEALCGTEDVYGKICEEACVTKTDRPYSLEGVIVRAVPLPLRVALATSNAVRLGEKHLRSRVASAVFAGDRLDWPSLINGAGLRSAAWCFGARLGGGPAVPLAVVGRAGSTTVFFDAWTARRERMEPPPRRYWATSMAMRPWDQFLAQVLQFQCQLHELFDDVKMTPTVDLCGDMRDDVRNVSYTLGILKAAMMPLADEIGGKKIVEKAGPQVFSKGPLQLQQLPVSVTELSDLKIKLDRHLVGRPLPRPVASVLIDGGIIELPPAGYLPVERDQIVNDQVVTLLGTGVDLRFCRVTPDFVAHALEEAQHMDRISLIEGLEPGAAKPPVDILIPDGAPIAEKAPTTGIGFEVALDVLPAFAAGDDPTIPTPGDIPPKSFVPTFKPAGLTEMVADLGGAGRTVVDDRGRDREIEDALNGGRYTVDDAPAAEASVVKVLGAGRAERLDGGGGAFYFGGTSDAPAGLKLDDFVRQFASIGTITREGEFDNLLKLKRTRAPLHHTGGDFLQRLNGIGSDARLFIDRSKGAEPFFQAAIDDAIGRASWKAPRQAAGKQLLMAWTSMQASDNPFELRDGQSTPIDLRVVVGSPSDAPSWIDYHVSGRLTVRHIESSGARARLIGVIGGGAAFTRSVVEGTAHPDVTDTGRLLVSAELIPTFAGRRLSLTVAGGKKKFVIDVRWQGSPMRAHVRVQCAIGASVVTLADGTLQENAAVLAAGSVWHGLAENAVYGIGALMDDSDFAQQSLASLFPPPPPAPTETRYRATLDWVLFHRRRIKDCGAPAVRATPAPGRRYAIWEREVGTVEEAAELFTLIMSSGGAGKIPPFTPITPVEFAASVPTLTSNADDLAADWERAATGDSLQFAVIASAASLDGALAIPRLTQVTQALVDHQVTKFSPQFRQETLHFVPSGLGLPETDGSILFVTLSKPKQTCHTVYLVDGQPIPQNALDELQKAGGPDQILAMLLPLSRALGPVQFNATEADVLPTPDREIVKGRWQGKPAPAQVLGFGSSGAPMAGDAALVRARAQSISMLLGDTGKTAVYGALVRRVLTPCPGATFVFPALDHTTHRVFVVDVTNLGAAIFSGFLAELHTRDLASIVKRAQGTSDVLLVRGTATIQSVQTPLDLSNKQVAIAVYSRPSGGTDLEPVAAQALQGKAIGSRFRAAQSSAVAAVTARPSSWPDGAIPHVTIIYVGNIDQMKNEVYPAGDVVFPQSLRVPRRVTPKRPPRKPKKPR